MSPKEPPLAILGCWIDWAPAVTACTPMEDLHKAVPREEVEQAADVCVLENAVFLRQP